MKMVWYDFFLKILSKARLFDIHIHYYKTEIDKIIIGNESYDVREGFINFEEGKKIKVAPTGENINFIFPDGTSVSRKSKDKEKEIRYLDEEKKVFTRSDIINLQAPFLSIKEEHERIINSLKPYLEDYRADLDLGSLLIASTIIKLEDNLDDKKLINSYYKKLHAFGKIGHMIYNFFRSGLLEKEIIPHLQKLMGFCKTHEELRRQFLIYWSNIISVGYPTAHFVREEDSRQVFYNELKWRLDRGEKKLEVYSRTTKRNKQVKRWLRGLSKRWGIQVKESPIYKIGYSKALKFKVYSS